MRHIKLTTKSLPRRATDEECCTCLSQTGYSLYKCTKQGRCPPGWSGTCGFAFGDR